MKETSFANIIKKFTGSEFSEPTEAAITWLTEPFGRLFDSIGYSRNGIQPFGAILEWMARYQLATFDHEKLEVLSDTDTLKVFYDQEIKGKRFRMPKGLLLCGQCGTGKTLAARIIAERFGLPFIDTYEISFDYQKKEGYEWLEKWLYANSNKAVIIDDLGAEGDIRKFGNESPIRAIISTRARFWEMHGTPTIYTTNKQTAKDLADHYGGDLRMADRLASYQVGVAFTGASLRR